MRVPHNTKLPTEADIMRLYVTEGFSLRKTADLCKCNYKSLANKVAKMGVSHRTPGIDDKLLSQMMSDPANGMDDFRKAFRASPRTIEAHIRGIRGERRRVFKDEVQVKKMYDTMTSAEIGASLGWKPSTIKKHITKMGIGVGCPKTRIRCGPDGYLTVRMPNHPRADSGGRVFLHTLVAEQKLGRPLRKGEVVHHIDMVRGNNDPSNLYVFENHSTHLQAHNSLEVASVQLLQRGLICFKDGRYTIKGKTRPEIQQMRGGRPSIFSLETYAKIPPIDKEVVQCE